MIGPGKKMRATGFHNAAVDAALARHQRPLDELAPRVPSGSGQRLAGWLLLMPGLLAVLFTDGIALQRVGNLMISLGAPLLIWGSLLRWLRVLEERQIAVHGCLLSKQPAPAVEPPPELD